MFDVIKGTFLIKSKLGDNAQLFCNPVAQFAPENSNIVLESLHHSHCLVRRENAHVYFGDTQVGAHFHSADAHERPTEESHTLSTNNLGHILLNLAADLQLSFAKLLFHLLDINDEIVLLTFLDKDILAVKNVILAENIINISNFLLVDGHAAALDHLAGLAF